MEHEYEEDDWKLDAPLLAGLDKHVDPEVPEGYFEELPSEVLARIRAMEAPQADEVPVIALPQATPSATPLRILGLRRSIFWSAAAGIVLLVAFGTYFLRNGTETVLTADARIEAETMAQLASLDTDEVMADLNPSSLNDEQLFAMLGDEGGAAFEGQDHEIQRDDAYEYLQDVDLDDVDLQGLDIDLNDLQ